MKFSDIAIALVLICGQTSGFYLPGVAPHNFEKDEPVELKVNKLRYLLVLF